MTGPRRDERGLFELLLQCANGNVRRLAGRWLQLRIGLAGDGRRTPQLRALRVYAPRFDYQEHYLPELFRQQETRSEAPAPANGADLQLSKAGEFVTVEEALVQTADINATNGVVHTVDRVLMPPKR